jgi:hypothetical protein
MTTLDTLIPTNGVHVTESYFPKGWLVGRYDNRGFISDQLWFATRPEADTYADDLRKEVPALKAGARVEIEGGQFGGQFLEGKVDADVYDLEGEFDITDDELGKISVRGDLIDTLTADGVALI